MSALSWTRTNTGRFLRPLPLPLGYQSDGAEGGVRTRNTSPLRRVRLPLRHFRIELAEPEGFEPIDTFRCCGVAIRCLTTRPRLHRNGLPSRSGADGSPPSLKLRRDSLLRTPRGEGWRRVMESNHQRRRWLGFRDRLRSTARHPPDREGKQHPASCARERDTRFNAMALQLI